MMALLLSFSLKKNRDKLSSRFFHQSILKVSYSPLKNIITATTTATIKRETATSTQL